MTIKLDNNHTWDIHQTLGRLPDNPSAFTAPDKTWLARIIDTTTHRPVVKSALSHTRAQAIADAERQYTARNSR
jgi:hypothetical protein